MIKALLAELGCLRGGSFRLYKHVTRIDYYEHDDSAIVVIGINKGSGIDEVLFESPEFFGADAVEKALAYTIQELKKGGAA